MIENVVGGITIPMGMATNFLINGKDYLVPMALEEPSVVAAASNAAKMARVKGGFHVTNTGPVMIGQIQTVDVQRPVQGEDGPAHHGRTRSSPRRTSRTRCSSR